MATSSTSTSALLSGAAKDDVVGLNGDYTFTVKELLANDPGGAAKYDLTKQFFFGDSGGAANMTAAAQTQYMLDHHITKISDLDGGTYQINAGAEDFNYFVQIGNKGTWSEAHVDVAGAPPPPVVEGHLTNELNDLFIENFDTITNGTPVYDPSDNSLVAAVTDLHADTGWTGLDVEHSEVGFTPYGGIPATSGNAWLDTQNSPGGINISHMFIDNTDAVAGQYGAKALPGHSTTSVLSFDIAKEAVHFNGADYTTDPQASFEFRIDGVAVAAISAADLENSNQMYHFDINIGSYANAGATHTLELVDTTPADHINYAGFAVDSVHIHDWIV